MKVAFLLDTNIVSFALRGGEAVKARLAATPRDKVAISVITEMELRYGLAKKPGATRTKAIVDAFLATMPVDNFPDTIADHYGRLRANLERQGTPLGPLDTIIAAHALALGCTLVTNNVREFNRVRGLRCQDWSRER